MTDMPFVAPHDRVRWGSCSSASTPTTTELARVYEVKAGKDALAPLGVAPGLRRDPRLARSRRSSTSSRATSSSSCTATARTASARTGTSSRAARAWATAACPATRTASLTTPRAIPGDPRRDPDGFGPVGDAILRRVRAGAAGRSSGRRSSASSLYLNWGERRVRRLFYLGGLVLRGGRDAGQGARGLRPPDPSRRSHASRHEAPVERAPPPRDRDAGSSSGSRSWRSPGTSRCTCATDRRSPTGSSSTTCSTAPFTTCTTRTRATTRASASTSGSSATRSSRGRGSRRSASSTGCAASDSAEKGSGDAVGASSSCGSSSRSRSSRSWGRSSTTTSSPPCPPVAMLIGDRARRHARQGGPRRPRATGAPRTIVPRGDCSPGFVLVVAGVARMHAGVVLRRRSRRHEADAAMRPRRRRARGAGGGSRWCVAFAVMRRAAPRRRRAGERPTRAKSHERAHDRQPRRSAGRSCSLLVGARPRHQARRRGPAGRHPAAPALHVQLPARLARLARLLRSPARRSRVVAWRSVARARRSCAIAAARGLTRAARSRSSWARLGHRRLHGEDGAALGAARGHRGLLRRTARAPTRCSSPTR